MIISPRLYFYSGAIFLIMTAVYGGLLYTKPGLCERTTNKLLCQSEEIERRLSADDIQGAFKKMFEFSSGNPNFQTQCHDLMHLIGNRAYLDFKERRPVTYTPQMNDCSFGFFHGFMEKLVQETGAVTDATRFCASHSSFVIPRDECFHGIGHGIVDQHDPHAWRDVNSVRDRALLLCRSIAITAEDYRKCAGGVYNGIANVYWLHQYDVRVDPHDPFKICKDLTTDDSEQDCYAYMARIFLVKPWNFSSALRAAQKESPSRF